jgi:hypothetical protein
MSPPLYLLRGPVRLSRLALYAGDRGWTRRRRADGREADAAFDAGRALHHMLDETFGPSLLKPFRLMVPPDFRLEIEAKLDLSVLDPRRWRRTYQGPRAASEG